MRSLNLKDQDIKTIADLFLLADKLQTLNLEFGKNQLTSKGLSNIIDFLDNEENEISDLVLSMFKNNIDSGSKVSFRKFLKNKKSLTYFNLDLSENKITDEVVEYISMGIESSLLKIVYLDFSQNKEITNKSL